MIRWLIHWRGRHARIEQSRLRMLDTERLYFSLMNQRPEAVRISGALSDVHRRNHIAEQVAAAFRRV